MGMEFYPMYQPVTTVTIKADGNLNVNPYDVLATNVRCNTAVADEFVGPVGNFDHALCKYLALKGTLTLDNTGYVYAQAPEVTLTKSTTEQSITIPDYEFDNRIKVHDWLYITQAEGEIPAHTTRTLYLQKGDKSSTSSFSFKKASDAEYVTYTFNAFDTRSFDVEVGETYNYYFGGNTADISGKVQALQTYYVSIA